MNLTNVTGDAVIADNQGQGTITNEDGATHRSRLMFHCVFRRCPPPISAEPARGTADADGDGDDELALYDSATGHVVAWNVNGPTVVSTIPYSATQNPSQAYNLVGTKTDFNIDGKADFLWHNPTPTGVFSMWFMNGTSYLGTGPRWTPQNRPLVDSSKPAIRTGVSETC